MNNRNDNPDKLEKALKRAIDSWGERAATLPSKGARGLDFLKFRVETTEPWQVDREYFRDLDRIDAIAADRSERATSNARKPRPSRKHPRSDEALKLAKGILKTNPTLSIHSVAVRTATKMDGDDAPSVRSIERYLREK